ncbi:zinc-binding dehydrogenase [Novosphingobium sp.]|uniref:zinc-binding dehydrogenase n=1 Tax=Novosphingobium sp. TaxID=1874826 RepID=UPI002FE20AEC
MKALVVVAESSARTLVLAELPEPVPGPDDLLVAVHHAGVNRADLALSASHYPSTAEPIVAGKELAGTVIGMGRDCRGFDIGDRVMALSSGCFAEVALADHRLTMRLPETIDFITAASLPAWYLTAHNALVTEGGMVAGADILIQGATSGVGMAVAQIAKLRGARRIIGIGRNQEKLARLAGIDVDLAIAARAGWHHEVVAATDGQGVDLVVDMVGGGVLQENLAALKLRGRMVAVGRIGGTKDMLDLEMLALKRLTIVGVTFRTRTIEERAAIVCSFQNDLLPAIAERSLLPLIDTVFSLDAFEEARDYVMRDDHFGKVVLQIMR